MTTCAAEHSLTQEDVDAYHRDGFVIIRGLYQDEEVKEWKRHAVDALEYMPSSGVMVWFVKTLPAFFREKLVDPKIAEPVKQLIGPSVEFCSTKPVFKTGAVDFGSPWHQDWAYWFGAAKLSAWIALDDATTENGCLKVIPGSHIEFLEHAQGGDQFVNRISDEQLEGKEVLTVEMAAGDTLFFHDRLIHSSFPNSNGKDRWSMIPTYRNADIHDESTVWEETIRID